MRSHPGELPFIRDVSAEHRGFEKMWAGTGGIHGLSAMGPSRRAFTQEAASLWPASCLELALEFWV